jgi:7-cyano-7-deazaguanine synthase
MQRNKKAILLSGGMDSIALAYWLRPEVAITLDYGQRAAEAEIAAATRVARILGMEHYVLRIDCSSLGSGDLVGSEPISDAPITEWWPYRNQMLVTLALMKAIQLGVGELMVGSVKTDAQHLDGTPEFYEQLSKLVSMQEGEIKVTAPAIGLTTVELVQKAGIPDRILMYAHSCHTSNFPCGRCHGCNKYMYVKEQLGIL